MRKYKTIILFASLAVVILITNIVIKNKNNYSNITIIGDSRTVGLCLNDWYKSDKGTCIAKSAMGYDWFINDVISMVNTLKIDRKEKIVLNLGVNDLYNVYNYINKYKELAIGAWKDSMIVILSVNPTKYSYDSLNDEIDNFNDIMREALSTYKNVVYCDSSSYLKENGFDSADGLHYSAKTSKDIYNQIKQCVN